MINYEKAWFLLKEVIINNYSPDDKLKLLKEIAEIELKLYFFDETSVVRIPND